MEEKLRLKWQCFGTMIKRVDAWDKVVPYIQERLFPSRKLAERSVETTYKKMVSEGWEPVSKCVLRKDNAIFNFHIVSVRCYPPKSLIKPL